MKLQIQNLNVRLQKQPILRDLSLQVGQGEFLSLLGPSGCGKSTLLKTIAGLLEPESGRILIDGQDIAGVPIHRRGTVIVFQDLRLFPNMSVLDNVAFPLKMQGLSKNQRSQEARQLLEKVQLGELGARKISQLSGGQQQRVALARALAAKPKLLLLDEPFSALDENLREEMGTLVLALQRDFKISTILVTHDRQEALSMSQRVALLFDGQIVQVGSPRQVYEEPASRQVASYFGGGVFLPGRAGAGRFCCAAGELPCDQPAGDYELFLPYGALGPEQPGTYPVTVEALRFHGAGTLALLRGPEGCLWRLELPQNPAWQPGQRLSCRPDLTCGRLFPAEKSPFVRLENSSISGK